MYVRLHKSRQHGAPSRVYDLICGLVQTLSYARYSAVAYEQVAS
jgi:hypothetical protein